MGSAFSDLMQSKKALVALAAIGAVLALAMTARVDGQQALDFCKWVVMTLIGSQALVDASANHGVNRAPTTVVNNAAPAPATDENGGGDS